MRQQMASFMRRLAENQVVDAATAQEADHATTAGTAYEAIREESVQITEGLPEDALSIVTLELAPGSYILSATLGATALPGGPAVQQSAVVCELTVGEESRSQTVQVGTNAGNAMFQAMTIEMTAVLDAETVANASCWRPSGIGEERPLVTTGSRLIAYQVGEVVSAVVTE